MGTNIYARINPPKEEREKLALKLKEVIDKNFKLQIYRTFVSVFLAFFAAKKTLAYFWLWIGAKKISTMRKIVIHSLRAEFRALIRGLLTNVNAFFVPSASREELFRICQTTKCDLLLTDDVRMFMNGSDAMAVSEANSSGSAIVLVIAVFVDAIIAIVIILLRKKFVRV